MRCSPDDSGDPGELALAAILGAPTWWQSIIHGPSANYRRAVGAWLLDHKGAETARRYGLCGCADQIVENSEGNFRLRPMRCGHRLCPRCSRSRGSQRIRHVLEHLERGGYGTLWHMVLTQRVKPSESATETADRFEAVYMRWMREVRKQPVASGMRVTHCTWSRHEGWHYHVHVFLEVSEIGDDAESVVEHLRFRWTEIRDERDGTVGDPCYYRYVGGPGSGLPRDEAAQGEFWSDPKDQVSRGIQYVIRDACQGLEAWGLDGDDVRLAEFIVMVEGRQLTRFFGQWRQTADQRFGEAEAPSAEAEGASNEAKPFNEKDVVLGTLDQLWYRALHGDGVAKAVFQWLNATLSVRSSVGQRVSASTSCLTT